MLARSPMSALRALTAALGACALTGALAGPALAVPADTGPAATSSGAAADLILLHRSGIAVRLPANGTDVAAPDQQAPSPKSSSLGAGPAAGPQPQVADLRSPDSVDRASEAAKRAQIDAASRHYAQRTDLRSPDSVDRALAAAQLAQTHGGVVVNRQPPTWPVHPASLTPPSAAAPAGDGFDWGDAGIGAGGALAILLAALGALLLHRRHGGDLQGDLHGAPTAG